MDEWPIKNEGDLSVGLLNQDETNLKGLPIIPSYALSPEFVILRTRFMIKAWIEIRELWSHPRSLIDACGAKLTETTHCDDEIPITPEIPDRQDHECQK